MLETESSLPPHGRVRCSRCFGDTANWNVTQRETPDGWHIINNPMSWGSQTPRFLVLGVSKGTTQCDALNAKQHDQVPFDGFRPKLAEALSLLGLLEAGETIDARIRADERDWAFGSMVRCALGLVDSKDGSISRSGTVVQRLARMDEDASWLSICTSAFLSRLPERLKVCVLLSNDDKYVEACRRAITRLRPATRRINSVAYGDDQTTWVHIIHVAGPGKNHINDWFAGQGKQGRKRIEAHEAVSIALGLPLDRHAMVRDESGPSREPKGAVAADAAKTPRKVQREGRPLPANPTRDSIISRVAMRGDVQPHPDQADLHGTKYISAFLTHSGTAFAVDKMSASKQPIWFLDKPELRTALDGAAIPFQYYSPERGRNSNLHKLMGFKNGALLRAFPETADDAMLLVNLLSK